MMKNKTKLSNNDFLVMVFEIQEEDINFDTKKTTTRREGILIEVFGSKKLTGQ